MEKLPSAAVPRFSRVRAASLFIIVALIGLAADLHTKNQAFLALGMPGMYRQTEPELKAVYWIWPNVFGFQTALNPGALFGIAAGQKLFLVIVSLIFLTGIILYLFYAAWRSLFLSAILGMIAAGICGNLYDRLGLHGLIYPEWHPEAGEPIYAVRDWILCMIGTFPWPNFNIADSLLVCSVILLLIYTWITSPSSEEKN